MNTEAFSRLLDFYKKHFEEIYWDNEKYKWDALRRFHSWDIDAPDFAGMLEYALGETDNLLENGTYSPYRRIIRAAQVEPEEVRRAFRDLFRLEGEDYGVNAFRKSIAQIFEKNNWGERHDQDDRAISVYLFLRYPEKFYLYKYSMLRDFADAVQLENVPPRGTWKRVDYYFELCNEIQGIIKNDTDLLDLYFEKEVDPQYHLLVQDIIYSVCYYNNPALLNPNFKIGRVSTHVKKDYSLVAGASNIDYLEQEKRNSELGRMGEEYVYQLEVNKVKEYGLSPEKEVRWEAKDKKDSLGYDILSFDQKGREIYIEVKTTEGSRNSRYFITANELRSSIEHGKQYQLYRVYDFNRKSKKGRIDRHIGPLTDLCVLPANYVVIPY